MPRPGLPLTPASSTDIRPKDYHGEQSHEHTFTLPSPAMESAESVASLAVSVDSDSSYHTSSPKQGRKRRRASSIRQNPSSTSKVSLPPPPSRARKIIQMNPGGTGRHKTNASSTEKAEKAEKKETQSGQGKSKHQTLAGKKTARKTAHSIIERRRRSKMNEEFETLKGMIPACQGQTMHKLSILQAGIEYMRYLEMCVTDLKTGVPRPVDQVQLQMPKEGPTGTDSTESSTDDDDCSEVTASGAIEDLRSPADTPSCSPLQRHVSKITSSEDASRRLVEQSPSTTDYILPISPVLHMNTSEHKAACSCKNKDHGNDCIECVKAPSALADMIQEADQEATAALLMLNTDRRYSQRGEKTGGGLRIKDLLSH